MSNPTPAAQVPQNEAQTVAELARRAMSNRQILQSVPGSGLIVFEDKSIRSLEAFASVPNRKRASVKLVETSSFINYVNAHKVRGVTHLFGVASETGGSFTAILDYHEQAVQAIGQSIAPGSVPGWGEHNAVLTLETTPEWRRWIGANNREMSQEAFAEFLEDNMTDVIRPDAADLLEMALLLTGKKSVQFRSGKNLKNGSIDFQYTETIEEAGVVKGKRDDSMRLPDKFSLGIVPFIGAEGIEIDARLRFRINESGKLTFRFLLDRPYKVIQDACTYARTDIEQQTGLTVHMGTAAVLNPSV